MHEPETEISPGFFAPDSSAKELGRIEDHETSETKNVVLERTVWRKLDRRVLPLCAILYLLSFLDRSNISNARVAGMQKSLKMSNYEYSLALTTTYIPYMIAEFPSNLLLKRIGPNLMLPAMVAMWGIVTSMQGAIHGFYGLLACRFFLGLLEGGLFPGLTLYLSFFYPRTRLQVRIATFFASASLSSAFSGLLAAAIDKLNGVGGRPGWAWIFILEGVFTFLFGIISFFLLPASPERARFLSEEERRYVVFSLKKDGGVSEDDRMDDFRWIEIKESAKSPHVWFLAIALFFSGTILFGLAYFEPTIVAGLGYEGNRAQLMSVPPFVTAFVCSMISAFVSDRYRCRGRTVIFFSILEVIGFSIFYASKSPHTRYVSLFFSVTGCYCTAPALLTWLANNSAPYSRRATSVAINITMANLGGILATWLLGTLSPAPNYTKATVTFITMSVGTVIFSAVNLAYLSRENRVKAEKRSMVTREQEPTGLGDRSAWFVYTL